MEKKFRVEEIYIRNTETLLLIATNSWKSFMHQLIEINYCSKNILPLKLIRTSCKFAVKGTLNQLKSYSISILHVHLIIELC